MRPDNIIAVETTKNIIKLIEHEKIPGVSVENPLSAITKSSSIKLNDGIDDTSIYQLFRDYSASDLTVITCSTSNSFERVSQVLDKVGISVTPFHFSFHDEEGTEVMEEDEDTEDSLEDVLTDINEHDEASSYFRIMDFLHRVSEADFLSDDIGNLSLPQEVAEEEDDSENVFNRIEEAVILPRNEGSVYRHIAKDGVVLLTSFMLDKEKMEVEGDFEFVLSGFIATCDPEKGIVGKGDSVLFSGYDIASALEGYIPGIFTVMETHLPTDSNRGINEPITYSAWRIHHNGIDSLPNEDSVEKMVSYYAKKALGGEVELNYVQPQDIPYQVYPYLPHSHYDSDTSMLLAKKVIDG